MANLVLNERPNYNEEVFVFMKGFILRLRKCNQVYRTLTPLLNITNKVRVTHAFILIHSESLFS